MTSFITTLVAYGEDNRGWGGAFAVYRGLTESLPYHRFFNTPISEAAIVASAVGYALCGGRVIAELMYSDFLGRAGDEIFNQLAKWQAMSAGKLKMPVVLSVSIGFNMVPSIPRIGVCYLTYSWFESRLSATPIDAKGLMNSALVGTDPVVFFESPNLMTLVSFFTRQVYLKIIMTFPIANLT